MQTLIILWAIGAIVNWLLIQPLWFLYTHTREKEKKEFEKFLLNYNFSKKEKKELDILLKNK